MYLHTVYMVYGACTNHVLLWYVAIHIYSGSYVCWECWTTDCKKQPWESKINKLLQVHQNIYEFGAKHSLAGQMFD